jgi:cytochrome P450
MTVTGEFDIVAAAFDPAFTVDPYPTYATVRAQSPVVHSEIGWFTASYECAAHALRDPRMSSDERHSTMNQELRAQNGGELPVGPMGDMPVMLFMDPPDHTRLRSLVNQAFTPSTVATIRPRTEEVARELLDAAAEQGGTFDLIDALAYPLPMTIISELLDVPDADRPQFSEWSRALARAVDPSILYTPEIEAALAQAGAEITVYLGALIDARRRAPGTDLLSALVAAHDDDDRLDDNELLAMIMLLLIAGHETTMNLIGNGILALLQHPDQLALVRSGTVPMRSVVDELLRFDAPVQITQRVALEDVEIVGHTLAAGEQLIMLLGGANRDPSAFDDPDRLDVTRNDHRHLAFGGGIHHCLGAALARTEGEVAVRALLDRFEHIELAGDPVRRPTFTLRGLTSLPLSTT